MQQNNGSAFDISNGGKAHKPVLITADSTIDLTPELADRFQIKTLPLIVSLGDKSYLDGLEITPDDIFKRYYEEKILPKTAAPSIQCVHDFFESFVRQGYEIVHLDISAELSSVYQVAGMAAEDLPGVYVVDSQMLSTGVALLALEAAECRDQGMSAEEIYDHLNRLKVKVSTTFVLDNLEFMWKGGRCSGIVALGANLLQLKPALKLVDGKIVVYKKYRGETERVYRRYVKEQLADRKIRPNHIFLTESGEIDEGIICELMELIREKSGCREVHHTRAGCTVSSHCGPKTLGVLFIED